jgi:hypothetical protein
MDPTLDLQARRVFLSATLTTHVLQRIGRRIVPASGARDLLVLARNLDAERVERAHRLSFEPSYPGVTAGVEATSGGLRLLLACRALDCEGATLGVVFTTLIPSRLPQVSVAPSATPIPHEWRPPSKSS